MVCNTRREGAQVPKTGWPAIRPQRGMMIMENLKNGGIQRSLLIVDETLANLLPLLIVQNGYEQYYSILLLNIFKISLIN
ncbi:hypothetical protein SAMN05192573_11336 [Mucilaginibacter gossypii]|uniref:Uncharacterized protein n=1 Tax=Mucilaginibacter gossypii TaxID=551996 RepID=A0A1G8FR56_9SPHI|nr:hypothetical protein SAMN05192573_11336 [Mucilaginibacter gossypii]